jgi:3-methyladenine DNA glycosylase AlkD
MILADRPPGDLLAVARGLLRHGGFACRLIAYELIAHHPPAAQKLDDAAVERLGHGMATWGEVDCFAWYIAGPAWRARQLADATVLRWSGSTDRWWRRAAVVATVPLNARSRGGGGDTPRTVAVCAQVVDDRDDMVVKALSWALRELAKRDAAAVEAFLRDHDDRLAARVRREVSAKLTTGRKRPHQQRSDSGTAGGSTAST